MREVLFHFLERPMLSCRHLHSLLAPECEKVASLYSVTRPRTEDERIRYFRVMGIQPVGGETEKRIQALIAALEVGGPPAERQCSSVELLVETRPRQGGAVVRWQYGVKPR